MSIGVSAIGSTRPGRPEQPAHPVERLDVVAEQLPQADDQQVADDVAAHLAVAGEAVLEHPRPGVAPLVVAAERRQRHPQVTRRQDAELAAQPARRAAVVGDGDDGGEVVDDEVVDQPAQRGERGVQAVAAAEGDDRLGAVTLTPARGPGATARAAYPLVASRRAISSVIATLRCLPPVQPIAIVMNRLPSRR